MAENVVPGAESFRFGALDLHGGLQQIGDTDDQQVAEHRVLKRDGAILEGMGWAARRFQADVVFVGPDVRAQVVKVRTAIRKKSEDLLVHPFHGRIRARCTRIAGTLNIPEASNTATLSLTFVESGIDPDQTAVASQGITEKAQALTALAADFETLAALFDGADAAAATAALVAGAESYAAAAMDTAQFGTPDPGLSVQLENMEQLAVAAIDAIQSDPAAELDVDRFEALAAADLVYAAAIEVDDALASMRPSIVTYQLPAACSLVTLATQFYGDDGLDRMDEILANNPDLTSPHVIAVGTMLRLAAQTV